MSLAAQAPSVAEVASFWPRELGDVALLVVSRLDSTQRLARSLLERFLREGEPAPATLVVALEQTAGRGRRGRTWESSAGDGLWASLLIPVGEEGLPSVPMRVAVALAEALSRWAPGLGIKWPNDLLVGRRKLAGVLVDAVRRGDRDPTVIVGFGVNVAQRADELPTEAATSLRVLRSGVEPPALGELAAACARSLLELLRPDADWLSRYRSMSVHGPGERITCDLEEEQLEGEFLGFDERGFLRLQTGRGERTISSGEVFRW